MQMENVGVPSLHSERTHLRLDSFVICKTPVEVSTVSLPRNHGFPGEAPIFFETHVILNGEYKGLRRYSDAEEAVKGHNEMVADLKKLSDGGVFYGGDGR